LNGAQTDGDSATRRLPASDGDGAFYWTAGAKGRLLIGRCAACARYIHPPLPRCPECGGQVGPQPVCGRGHVASFTVNHQAWAPGLPVPFVFAAVELAEQGELYVFTNIVGCASAAVRIGMAVEVVFEQHAEVYLPMFRPSGHADGR
jgi:uncharacterized OB-fold protein